MGELPSGSVTLLFSDIEGSTGILQRLGEGYADVLGAHREILRRTTAAHGGVEVDTQGDSFFAAFPRAVGGLHAAVDAQYAMAGHPWPALGQVRVRMGLHTGEPIPTTEGYVGLDVHRAARLCAAGHGGQVLLSGACAELVGHALPEGTRLLDMGYHHLRSIPRPEHIYQVSIDGLPDRFRPLTTRDTRPTNLPPPHSSLIGREEEVAALADLVSGDSRLITLTGPGGVGKTRLALEVGAELLDQFSHGVFLVQLGYAVDARLLSPIIAAALGVGESGGRPLGEQLLDVLRDRQMLLLLDGFEPVQEAAPLLGGLLGACRRITVLVTSRLPLRLPGEVEFPVPPLAQYGGAPPGAAGEPLDAPAVRLFVERTLAVRPDFELTAEHASTVEQICARLDGLPLAIELAAARMKLLPPRAVLARLERRFALLSSGARDLPSRRPTLRGAIAWSYHLLTPPEQTLFRRLAVFADGCTLEATAAVCNAAGDLEVNVAAGMASLVDKRLLVQERVAEPGGLGSTRTAVSRERPARDSGARYLMLETVREYALERLAASREEALARRAHAGYYLDLAGRAGPQLAGAERRAWLERLDREHHNLRTALRSSRAVDGRQTMLRLAAEMTPYWRLRGHLSEGRIWLRTALTQDTAITPARAQALAAAGTLARDQGDYEEGRALLEQSVQMWRGLDDAGGLAHALEGLGSVRALQSDGAALSPLEECVKLAQAAENPELMARSQYWLGYLAIHTGDYPAARHRLEESLNRYREASGLWDVALPLGYLGVLALIEGQPQIGRRHLEESLTLLREADNPSFTAVVLGYLTRLAWSESDVAHVREWGGEWLELRRSLHEPRGIARALAVLGMVAREQRDDERSAASFAESLALSRENGAVLTVAIGLVGVASMLCDEGRLERAGRLCGAASELIGTLGMPDSPADRIDHARTAEMLGALLRACAASDALAEGHGMTIDEAITMALRS
jgi:predicted ATPase/class 3 adenylate cyclase